MQIPRLFAMLEHCLTLRVRKFMCILLRCCNGLDAKGEDLEMRNVSSKREQWSDWRRSWVICRPGIESISL